MQICVVGAYILMVFHDAQCAWIFSEKQTEFCKLKTFLNFKQNVKLKLYVYNNFNVIQYCGNWLTRANTS